MRESHVSARTVSSLHSAVAAALSIGAASAGAAVTISTPAGLSVGDKFHIVLVTDGTRDATSFDINDYDAFVSADIGATTYFGSPVMWQALASTEGGVSAVSRFNPATAGIYRLDGVNVADNGADLWDGTIDAPINVSPTSSDVVASVWTGSDTPGSEAKGLGGETVIIPPYYDGTEATSGDSSQVVGAWVSLAATAPGNAMRLYAFSSELTAVPEPTTAAVLAAGALACLAMRRGKC